MRHYNEKGQQGFAALLIVLLVFVIAVVAATSLSANNALRVSKANAPAPKPAAPKAQPTSCGNDGVIIVQFAASSKEQQQAIIAQEHATIKQDYSAISGLYALYVPKGQENLAINAFKAHPEVKSANLDRCSSANNVQ